MWVNLSKDQLELAKAALGVLTVPQAIEARTTIDQALSSGFAADNAAWVEAAKEIHQDEGLVEVDEQSDGSAMISRSDGGAYVMAWVWVFNSDIGIKGPFDGVIGQTDRFRITEDEHGYTLKRLADGAEAVWYGNNRCEDFRDQFKGDLSPISSKESVAENDDATNEFGDWAEQEGELKALVIRVA